MISIVAAWLGTSVAWAAPGDHIRAGDVELVPDVDLGAEYFTNVYRDENTAVPAANFRIAPGILAIAEGDDHEFKFDGEWVLRKYFFVADDKLASPLPTSERIGNLDRFDEFSLSAGANTFKRNVVGFKLSDDMALRDYRSDAELADVPYMSMFRNVLAAGLRLNPGPALEIVPGASWTFDSFRTTAVTAGDDRLLNNRNTYGPTLAAKWAFLPRTSFVANASWMVNDWQTNALVGNPAEAFGSEIALPNSNHVKVMGGVDGRFTEKLFAQLMVGYGVALYNEDGVGGAESATGAAVDATGGDGILVKGQLRYSITPTVEQRQGSSAAVGFVRDFRSSFFTNYVQLNELFVDYQGRLGDLVPSARYELRFEDYNGEITRHDTVNRVSVDLAYLASDWARVSGGVGWQQRASDDDTVEYDDVNIHLLATFAY
ncbi:MAG: hypothetical protein ABMB14_15410 [Myxococcota bacterium]